MTTKEKIIEALEEAKGEYVSGEKLAEDFELSRNAIWKAVNELKKAGYAVDLQYANNDIAMQTQQIENMLTKGDKILVIAAID